MKEECHLIDMPNGGKIALYHFNPPTKVGYPLIVTHGTISDMSAVRDLGRYLMTQGYDCWILEWGGHGRAEYSTSKQNFEFPAFNDAPTAIAAVLEKTNQEKLVWVSHSGGGHLLLMNLARHPESQSQIVGAVMLGAQATDATLKLVPKILARVLWAVTMLFNKTPHWILPIGDESEPTRLLAQWAIWSIRERWLGVDGFDYMAALAQIKIPTLIFAGGDDIIAPASGCKKFFDALGSGSKSWILCAESEGFSKDFSHGQLVRGRAARAEIFPKIGEWLDENNKL